MRTFAIVLLLAVAAAGGVTTAAGAGDPRVSVGGSVSVRLPGGWHLLSNKGTRVQVPVPRLAAATFDVRFSRHQCVCGTPNVSNFPRTGAFLFVWEYPHVARRDFKAIPPRPARFRIGRSAIRPYACAGPSDGVSFRQGGRGFQVEIYLGPAAPRAARAQIAAILDSWRVTETLR
ncbi:MAG: hypothetical protein WBQ18_04610 [Solirubrobacteraceae bacterium]